MVLQIAWLFLSYGVIFAIGVALMEKDQFFWAIALFVLFPVLRILNRFRKGKGYCIIGYTGSVEDQYTQLSVAENLQSLDRWLSNLNQSEKFNGTVLIANKGEILFQQNYGHADVWGDVPLANSSSFNLASVSKQFTAMGIMLLADRGKLDLDENISRYLPEFSNYKDVTIKHLLHHTSGLPDYIGLTKKHWDKTKTLSGADMIKLFEQHKPDQLFTTGEKFEYSNKGYVLLLAEIIERVSGIDHAVFMQKNIFVPLEMNNSAAFNQH